jgi:hypothetical protein
MSNPRYAMKGRETTKVPEGALPTVTLEAQGSMPETEYADDIPMTVVDPDAKPARDRKRRITRTEEVLQAMGVLSAALSRFPSARPGTDYKERDNYQHREFFTDQMTIALAESLDDLKNVKGCTHMLSIPSEHQAYDLGSQDMLVPHAHFVKRGLIQAERQALEDRFRYVLPEDQIQDALDRNGRAYAEMHKYCEFNSPSLLVYKAKEPSLDTLLRAALPDDGNVAIHSTDPKVVSQVIEQAMTQRRRPSMDVIDLEEHSITAGEKTFYFVGPAKELFADYVKSPKTRAGWIDVDMMLMTTRG